MRRVIAILTFLLAFIAAHATAQTTKLGPTDSIKVNWPTPSVSTDGLNAPDGYRVKAVSTTTPGTVLRVWSIGSISTLTHTIPPTEMPAGVFQISVHPYNVAGEAGPSNLSGPFGKAVTPTPYTTGVTAGVVSGAP
jgi:hypothetical protein